MPQARSELLPRGHAAQDGDGQLRPDPIHTDKLFKKMLLGQPEKSIKRDLIFAHVGMNMKRNLTADTRQITKRRHANRNVVPYARCFHHGLIRMPNQQPSPQMCNHGANIIDFTLSYTSPLRAAGSIPSESSVLTFLRVLRGSSFSVPSQSL